MEGRIKKRQETVDCPPGPKMKPSACIADKNDITVVRSFSQVAAEQYERKTTMFATEKQYTILLIIRKLLRLLTWSTPNYVSTCEQNPFLIVCETFSVRIK